MRRRYPWLDTVAALRLPLRALMTPSRQIRGDPSPYLPHPTDDGRAAQCLLPSRAAARGHKTDTSETTRATPRDTGLQTRPICRRNCVADDRACTRVTPRTSMVRRGSTVRVRQRACLKALQMGM